MRPQTTVAGTIPKQVGLEFIRVMDQHGRGNRNTETIGTPIKQCFPDTKGQYAQDL